VRAKRGKAATVAKNVDKRTPVERMIDGVMRCLCCGAKMGACACHAHHAHPAVAAVSNGDIVIRVPLGVLKAAVLHGPDTEGVVVTSPAKFARDVVAALNFEDEIGASAIHRMFDDAFHTAIDNGAEGVKLPPSGTQ
jgi:hypothetical protein